MSDKQDAENPYLRTIILNTMRLASTCRGWHVANYSTWISKVHPKCFEGEGRTVGGGAGVGRKRIQIDDHSSFPSNSFKMWPSTCPRDIASRQANNILRERGRAARTAYLNLRRLAFGRIIRAAVKHSKVTQRCCSVVEINLQTNVQKEAESAPALIVSNWFDLF